MYYLHAVLALDMPATSQKPPFEYADAKGSRLTADQTAADLVHNQFDCESTADLGKTKACGGCRPTRYGHFWKRRTTYCVVRIS
jgi:hypothetical protein